MWGNLEIHDGFKTNEAFPLNQLYSGMSYNVVESELKQPSNSYAALTVVPDNLLTDKESKYRFTSYFINVQGYYISILNKIEQENPLYLINRSSRIKIPFIGNVLYDIYFYPVENKYIIPRIYLFINYNKVSGVIINENFYTQYTLNGLSYRTSSDVAQVRNCLNNYNIKDCIAIIISASENKSNNGNGFIASFNYDYNTSSFFVSFSIFELYDFRDLTSWVEYDISNITIAETDALKYAKTLFKKRIFYITDNITTTAPVKTTIMIIAGNHKDSKIRFYFLIYVAASYNSIGNSNAWKLDNGVPEDVFDGIGAGIWFSSDYIYMFAVTNNENNYGKGLITLKGNISLIDQTNSSFGWNKGLSTYSKNDASTLDLRNVVTDKYVLEMIFNTKGDKIILLCNSQKGSFGVEYFDEDYYEGIQPDSMYCFALVKNKWKQLSIDALGLGAVWNSYTAAGTGGYSPMMSFDWYDNSYHISYAHPAWSTSTKVYYSKLTWD